jgi:hypothetical protein
LMGRIKILTRTNRQLIDRLYMCGISIICKKCTIVGHSIGIKESIRICIIRFKRRAAIPFTNHC